MASFPNLIPGQTLAVFYDDDTFWHERLVLWRLQEGFWYVLTPDFDIYAEDLTCSGGVGPSRVKVKGKDFKYWSRVGGAAYRLASPVSDDQQLRAHIKQALRDAVKEDNFDQEWKPDSMVDTKGVVQEGAGFLRGVTLTRRLVGKGPAERTQPNAEQADAIASIRPITPASMSQVWLAMETIDSCKLGDSVAVDLHLHVDTDEQGTRFKEWRKVVSESQFYSYDDFPRKGPATVHHLLKHVGKYGGDPKLWLELWCRQKSISDQDRVKHELRCLMEVLYLGGTFDQLNMPVLASFETVARRVQSIVDAYSFGGNVAPDWGNAKLFTGYAGPDDLVMPQLKTWAARRGKEEVELFNARNKMRELRRGAVVNEEAAAAAADGSLPAGATPKPRAPRKRGKGLEPPAQST